MNETLLTQKQKTLYAFRNVFDTAFELTVIAYIDKLPVLGNVISTIRESAVTSIMTPDGLTYAADLVFGDTINREFVMTLQANFYSLMGEYHQTYVEFIEGIAYGLTCDTWGSDLPDIGTYNLIPVEFSEHIFDQKTVSNYLRVNKWLLIYVLLILWARVPTEKEIRDSMRNQVSKE